jgi:hypothetical protein
MQIDATSKLGKFPEMMKVSSSSKFMYSFSLAERVCSELVAFALPGKASAFCSLITQVSHSNTTTVHPSPIREGNILQVVGDLI